MDYYLFMVISYAVTDKEATSGLSYKLALACQTNPEIPTYEVTKLKNKT